MERALPAVILLLSGCTKNHDELRARLDADTAELAAQMAKAGKLNDDRRALDQAQQELARALTEHPEAKAEVDDVQLPPPVMPTFDPLPPESMFEGERGARMRRQIQDTDARIASLAKVLAEVEKIDLRRRHVERQLAAIRERHPPK